MRTATALLALTVSAAFAQEIRLPANLDQLASKANESVDVTLAGPMLKLAAQFVAKDGKDKDDVKASKALEGLESVTVRSYKFASEGQYDPADAEAIRAQLKSPAWSRIIGVKTRSGSNADIYLKVNPDLTLGGAVVLAAEPAEFTFVSVMGRFDLAQLADLGGKYHIPALDVDAIGRGLKAGK